MNIAELVLRGFEKRDSDRIAAAFERRLHDLLRSGTLPASWRRTTRAGTLRIQPLVAHRSSNLAEIGERLAQAVFALRRDDRGGRDNT